MKDLKWWQWTLIIVLGLAILGKFADEPDNAKPARTVEFADPDPKFQTIAGNSIFAMTFDPMSDPDKLPTLAREKCGKLAHCQIVAWTDPAYSARGFPMTDREVEKLAFSYLINRATGHEQVVWDCRRWKRASQDECLSTAAEAEDGFDEQSDAAAM